MAWLANRATARVMTRPQALNRMFSQGIVRTMRTAPSAYQYAGGAAALGVGGLCAWGLSQPASYVPASARASMGQFGGKAYAERVRWRVGKTYAYLTAGLAMTGATAVFAFSRGLHVRMMQMNPMVMAFGGFLGIMMMGGMTRATPYENPAKLAYWGAMNAMVGLTLVPVGLYGGALVSQAAMITACIVGSLSAVAACSPGDQFLNMGPMLGCGLGVVIAASFGGMFFPGSAMLMNISLYGGLGLFGLYVCHDTQKVLYHAQMDNQFDPINNQIGIYMDSINIFIRIVQILAMSGGKRK